MFVDLMDFSGIKSDPDVGAVMCGFDMHMKYVPPPLPLSLLECEEVDENVVWVRYSYQKLARAFRYLRENEGCLFIMTNDDSVRSLSPPLLVALSLFLLSFRFGFPSSPLLPLRHDRRPTIETN